MKTCPARRHVFPAIAFYLFITMSTQFMVPEKYKLQERQFNLPVNKLNLNFTPSPTAGKPKLCHMKED